MSYFNSWLGKQGFDACKKSRIMNQCLPLHKFPFLISLDYYCIFLLWLFWFGLVQLDLFGFGLVTLFCLQPKASISSLNFEYKI